MACLQNLRSLRTAGEPDPLLELISLFLKDSPGRLQQLRAALDAAELLDIERAAHSLKGSASNLGAQRMALLCAQIVRLARDKSIQGMRGLFEQLEAEYQRVRDALEQESARPGRF